MLGRQARKVVQVLVGVSIPGPDGTLYPQPEVIRIEQRVVQRAGQRPRALGVEVGPSPVGGEEPAFALADHLGVRVQRPHQPGGTGFAQPRDEEHGGILPRSTPRTKAGLLLASLARGFALGRRGVCTPPLRSRAATPFSSGLLPRRDLRPFATPPRPVTPASTSINRLVFRLIGSVIFFFKTGIVFSVRIQRSVTVAMGSGLAESSV